MNVKSLNNAFGFGILNSMPFEAEVCAFSSVIFDLVLPCEVQSFKSRSQYAQETQQMTRNWMDMVLVRLAIFIHVVTPKGIQTKTPVGFPKPRMNRTVNCFDQH